MQLGPLAAPCTHACATDAPRASAKNMYIYFSNSVLNLTDIQVILTGSKNHYQSQVLLPAKGNWHMDVQLLIDPFTEAQAALDTVIK
jgi:hypothetical protein